MGILGDVRYCYFRYMGSGCGGVTVRPCQHSLHVLSCEVFCDLTIPSRMFRTQNVKVVHAYASCGELIWCICSQAGLLNININFGSM